MTPRFTLDFGSGATPEADGRLHAPAFARNHEPIWSAIGPWLATQSGDVLELASGTGEHSATYAPRTPRLTWWPSDMDNPAHFASIRAWRDAASAANMRDPQRIDLMDANWAMSGPSPGTLAAMLAINVTHISPWAATQNLIAGAGRWLKPGGRLFVYGPFMQDGTHTAPSNAQFDESLRAGNPAWGVRDIAALAALGKAAGVPLIETVAMPANNFTLIFERA